MRRILNNVEKKNSQPDKILADFNKMKQIAGEYCKKKDWEHALQTIFIASGFMYTMNQVQCDSQLEQMVEYIAKQKIGSVQNYNGHGNTILYYDAFCSVQRGLTKIYLKALVDLGYQVKYVTVANHNSEVEAVAKCLKKENVYCICGQTHMERMLSLTEIIRQSQAGTAFLYMTPDDVIAVGAFSLYKGVLKRYMINLTDHAFWLGTQISDFVINFREFGQTICKIKRNFREEQLVYLPYYPDEVQSEFEGFHFSDNSRKLIFSGGALYKTESKDNQYYTLIDKILAEHQDINFLYLGNGDARKMQKIIKKYPGRARFETERTDFFEIMKRCTLYLSTYPYNGGLMTQYALLAGKIPLTLCCSGIERELTIHNKQSFWNVETADECLGKITKLLSDADYRQEKEKKLKYFLIDEIQFAEELKYILVCGHSKRSMENGDIEFEGFRKIPAENYTAIKYCRLFFRKNGLFMLKFFPAKYVLGAMGMILEKIYKYK